VCTQAAIFLDGHPTDDGQGKSMNQRHILGRRLRMPFDTAFGKAQKSQFRMLALTPPTTTPEKIYKTLTPIQICIVC
jgi:hypothetical protein